MRLELVPLILAMSSVDTDQRVASLVESLSRDIERTLQSSGWNGRIGTPSRVTPLSFNIEEGTDSVKTYSVIAALDDIVVNLLIEERLGDMNVTIPTLSQLSFRKK